MTWVNQREPEVSATVVKKKKVKKHQNELRTKRNVKCSFFHFRARERGAARHFEQHTTRASEENASPKANTATSDFEWFTTDAKGAFIRFIARTLKIIGEFVSEIGVNAFTRM